MDVSLDLFSLLWMFRLNVFFYVNVLMLKIFTFVTQSNNIFPHPTTKYASYSYKNAHVAVDANVHA